MAEEINKEERIAKEAASFFPRSVLFSPGERIKRGETIPSPGIPMGGDVSRGPARRFYAPDLMLSTMFIPVDRITKNKWRRWFYERDVIVGPVIDLQSDLPWSSGDINCPDPYIKQVYEQAIEKTDFFQICRDAEREFMIAGEVTLHFYFDEHLGYWSHIIIHDPDYIEIEDYPLVNFEKKIYIIPDDALRIIMTSNDSLYSRARQRIPKNIAKNILWGKNLLLANDRTAHMLRKVRPNQTRGTSVIDRLFRYLMYEDKLIEAEISIADNYIYPLKIFKLGNAEMGVPPKTHADALSELLLHAQFDPNFAIIYHYGLQYEQHGYEGKLLRMEQEFDRINNMKMLALGVNNEFLTGSATYASANAYLQMLFSKAATTRARHERSWIYPKFFKTLAKIRGFYKRTTAELSHGIRIKRSAEEDEVNLIIPKINWHKSLSGREDREFLDFLKDLWTKSTISSSTLMSKAGLDFKQELENMKNDERAKLQTGTSETTGTTAFFKMMRKKVGKLFKKEKQEEESKELVEYPKEWKGGKVFEDVPYNEREIKQLNASMWKKTVERVKSPILRDALENIDIYVDGTQKEKEDHIKLLYRLGKEVPYTLLEISFDGNTQSYDELLFEDFIMDFDDELMFRRACLDAFSIGQLMGLQELGVNGTRLYYVNEDNNFHFKRFKVSSLLSQDFGLGNKFYPEYEILYFFPEIYTFQSPRFVADRIVTVITKNGKKVENLPIEYKSFFEKESIKKDIRFVEFPIKDKEWMKEKIASYKKIGLEDDLILGMVQKDASTDIAFKGKDRIYISYKVFEKNGHPYNDIIKPILEE